MKLSHLSLAILSAIALAACGGSGSDDHTTDPNANKPGATDQTPKQPEDKKDEDKKEDTAKEDAKIVDPTGDQVVDNISLAETSTTASQQYLRGKASQFDRIANPNQPASATVLSGITLDLQNPQLTNIVVGRIDDKNSKGERVQVAFYAGSDSNQMKSVRTGTAIYPALQKENARNALIGGPVEGFGSSTANSGLGFENAANKSNLLGSVRTMYNSPLMGENTSNIALSQAFKKYVIAYNRLKVISYYYDNEVENYKTAVKDALANSKTKIAAATAASLDKVVKTLETRANDFVLAQSELLKTAGFESLGLKATAKQEKIKVPKNVDNTGNTIPATVKALDDLFEEKSLDIPNAIPASSMEKYGLGLNWFTTDGNFTNSDTGWGDHIDAVKGVVGDEADGTNMGPGAPTTGLVGIYKNNSKWVVRGSEANNVRTTRIFGHYYLDPGSSDKINLNPEGKNSWSGAGTFITGLDTKGDPNRYGLGAAPITLNHVQYGRVTATIDDNDVAKYAGTSGWVKKHQDFANRDPKYANDADNFYFYRGTNATSIEDMAKLPTDATIAYQGHALMYGIDNSFHGGGQELPNAFGNQQSYGLGNFVKANLNMGSKKFDGYVYNVWGTPSSAEVKEDKLVEFSGDVTGNTVIGTANLAYDTSKTGDLRASFYGAGAEEVGGAINSVKRQDPYGPIGWGGVFGAQRTTSGNSAWLVSSKKK